MPQSIPGKPVFLHCLDFQVEDRLTPRWLVGQPCGNASWESLVGKPRGKAKDPLIPTTGSVTLLHTVPEVTVLCREHLPQLEKIQEVLPCTQEEGLFR